MDEDVSMPYADMGVRIVFPTNALLLSDVWLRFTDKTIIERGVR